MEKLRVIARENSYATKLNTLYGNEGNFKSSLYRSLKMVSEEGLGRSIISDLFLSENI